MTDKAFQSEPAVDYPGWFTWDLTDQTLFNAQVMGTMFTRIEDRADGGKASRLRMFPERRHSNVVNSVHGGVTLALIDIALFAAIHGLLEGNAAGAVTLDLSNQFISAGRIGEPLDAVVEVLRETGRLVFLRGVVVQGDDIIAAFNGTIRKPTKP